MKQRLLEFDIAKALCIILVVIGHYSPIDSPKWWTILHDIIYTFHMPLFMFASGFIYIAFKKSESYWQFLFRKVKRLMVPYITVSIIVIAIKLLTQRGMYVENPVSWISFIKMFYLPEAGYFLWFIWALWWMFCITPLFKTKKTRLYLVVIAIAIHFIPFELTQAFCIKQTSNMMIYFILGVFCFDWKEQLAFLKRLPSSAIYFIFFCLEFLYFSILFIANDSWHCELGLTIIHEILPFIGIGMIMSLSAQIAKIRAPKALLIISGSSYMVYLFHTTFEGFAKSFIHKLPMLNGENGFFFLGALVVISAGIICPILLHRYVLDKTTTTKTLFGLK